MCKYQYVIGPKLRIIREAKGMTLRELSRRSGIPHPSLSNYELGKRSMDVDQLNDICNALGLSMVEFLSGVIDEI